MLLLGNKPINIWKEHQIVPSGLQVFSGKTSLRSKQISEKSSWVLPVMTFTALRCGEKAWEKQAERPGAYGFLGQHAPHRRGQSTQLDEMMGQRDLVMHTEMSYQAILKLQHEAEGRLDGYHTTAGPEFISAHKQKPCIAACTFCPSSRKAEMGNTLAGQPS